MLRGSFPARAGRCAALLLLLSSAALAESSPVILVRHPSEPGAAPVLPTGSPNPVDRLDFEASLREIYGRFTEVTRKSGNEVRFEISDVTVYRPSQFKELLWSEIGDVEPGPTIPTILASRERELPSQVEYAYEAKWQEAHPAAAETFAGFQRSAAGLSFSKYLELAARMAPEQVMPIDALTRFTVTVSLAGRSRTYKSNAFWRAWGPDSVAFWLSELVVSRVEDAWHEDRPIRPVQELDSPQFPLPPEPSLPAANSRFTCRTTSRFHNLPGSPTYGFEGHTTGQHSASLSVPLTCSTTAACTSHCATQQPYTSCTEVGTTSTFFRHEIHNKRHTSSISGLGPGLTSECGYAWGCAVRECLRGVPICAGIQFTVAGGGAQVALRADPAALVDLSTQAGGVCPAAIPVDDRDGPPCEEETPGMLALDLHGKGEPIPLGSGAVTLRRLEPSTTMHHGHEVSYLMGEWALVSVPPASAGGVVSAEVKGATVEDFGVGVVAGLSETLAAQLTTSMKGEREALVVAVPLHEPNSRRIPLPALHLEAQPSRAPGTTGRALLLADFGEDHSLQKLHVLHSTAFVSRDLALYLERSLKLRPQTAEPHRVVAFVLVEVGAKVEIVSQLMYLPRCCCGDYFCQ